MFVAVCKPTNKPEWLTEKQRRLTVIAATARYIDLLWTSTGINTKRITADTSDPLIPAFVLSFSTAKQVGRHRAASAEVG